MAEIFDTLKTMITTFLRVLEDIGKKAESAIHTAVSNTERTLKSGIKIAKNELEQIFERAKVMFNKIVSEALTEAAKAREALVNAFSTMMMAISSLEQRVATIVKSVEKNVSGAASALKSDLTAVKNAGSADLTEIENKVSAMESSVEGS